MGACDNRSGMLLDGHVVRAIRAHELVAVEGDEPGLNGDVEERVSPARYFLGNCALDALAFERVQVDGRGGQQEGRYANMPRKTLSISRQSDLRRRRTSLPVVRPCMSCSVVRVQSSAPAR